MSENTVNAARRTMGYDIKVDVCGRGFRAMGCSALAESGLWSEMAIERQMSHKERNNVRAAYTHKAEFPRRTPDDHDLVEPVSGGEPRGPCDAA